MNSSDASPNENPEDPSAESETIPLSARVVLWMFLLGFVLFGAILLGDLVVGFFR